ncbi:MAG: 16S rRNA (cytidine(1402)-2'-O)-methyltransferase [Gammaproteobacteria bacterium]|nr:16S rRNA (cytidine(1402)-2'-O)-methyltransferase [Gammaproteobacteria bacterium]
MNRKTSAGALFIVATPIGNLGDITRRAVETLATVDLILAEDTRRAGALLSHLGIRAPVQSFHQHNEAARLPTVLRRLADGAQVALISDAGTPLISDPGRRLVRRARQAGVRVSPLPGASAVTAALSAAGQPAARFCFEGFLPATAAARARRLRELRDEPRTLVCYESSHRIAATLDAMAAAFGDAREVTVAREISKRFETFYCGDLAEVRAALAAAEHRKGEFVIITAGAPPTPAPADHRAQEIMELLSAELPLTRASRLTAQITGVNRNTLYAAAVKARNESGEE